MGVRRFLIACVTATLLVSALAAPAAAKRPDPGTPPTEPPQTEPDPAASARKAARAERYVAEQEAHDLATLECVVLSAPTEDGAVRAEATGAGPAPTACYVPQGFLAVEARDQNFGHYCGPAVGQVIANYSWAVAAGTNKYLQRDLAAWMATDANGGTSYAFMESALERATAGSPRRPWNWDWLISALRDSDGDGTVGDQLYSYVRANVSGDRMPLAVSVKPHDRNSRSGAYLLSWPRVVDSVGHWIAIYGWVGVWDGSDRPRIYYTDSSKDEGGSTGKFWTPTRWFGFLITEHTGLFVW
jgi:hypothetical protein